MSSEQSNTGVILLVAGFIVALGILLAWALWEPGPKQVKAIGPGGDQVVVNLSDAVILNCFDETGRGWNVAIAPEVREYPPTEIARFLCSVYDPARGDLAGGGIQ